MQEQPSFFKTQPKEDLTSSIKKVFDEINTFNQDLSYSFDMEIAWCKVKKGSQKIKDQISSREWEQLQKTVTWMEQQPPIIDKLCEKLKTLDLRRNKGEKWSPPEDMFTWTCYSDYGWDPIKLWIKDLTELRERMNPNYLAKVYEDYVHQFNPHEDTDKLYQNYEIETQCRKKDTNALNVDPETAKKDPQLYKRSIYQYIEGPCQKMTYLLNLLNFKTTWSNGVGYGAKGVWFKTQNKDFFIDILTGNLYRGALGGGARKNPDVMQVGVIRRETPLDPKSIGLNPELINLCIFPFEKIITENYSGYNDFTGIDAALEADVSNQKPQANTPLL